MSKQGYFDTVRSLAASFLKDTAKLPALAQALDAAPLMFVPYLKAGNATHGSENEADRRFSPTVVRLADGKSEERQLVGNVQREGTGSVLISLIHAAVWNVARELRKGKVKDPNRVYGKEFNELAASAGLAPLPGASAKSSQYFAVREDSPLDRWLRDHLTEFPPLPETFDGTGEGTRSGGAVVKMTATDEEKARGMSFIMFPAPNYEKDPDKALTFLDANRAFLMSGTHKNTKTNEDVPDHKPTRTWVQAVETIAALQTKTA